MTRVAAIDCGTNSLRLLIADVDPGRRSLADVDRRMEIVRLGQAVDRTGRLAPEALQRTFGALRQYAGIISATGAQAVRMVATSATRDAENANEFAAGVREILGADPEVITGSEEAALSFAGATAELSGTGINQPYLVVDIGGGSTEFVLGRYGEAGTAVPAPGEAVPGGTAPSQAAPSEAAPGRLPSPVLRTGDDIAASPSEPGTEVRGEPGPIAAAISVNIGSVRLTERHLHGDPPTPAEIAAATADIDAALELVASRTAAASASTLVGLAGSITTVAAIAMDLPEYDPAAVHHSRQSVAAVHQVTRRLLASSRAERAKIGSLHPGRVDVIGAGSLILDRIMAKFGFGEVVVSEHDILDGIALGLADRVAPGDGTGP